MEIAVGMEAADKSTKDLKANATPLSVGHVSSGQKPGTVACKYCGRKGHERKDCKFWDSTCHRCGKKGHIAPVCRSSCRNANQTFAAGSKKPIHSLDTPTIDEQEVFTLGYPRSPLIGVELLVQGKPLKMEVDTGAAVSIIPEDQLIFSIPRYIYSHLQLCYIQAIEVVGQVEVTVRYQSDPARKLTMVVMKRGGAFWTGTG